MTIMQFDEELLTLLSLSAGHCQCAETRMGVS